MRLLRVLRLTGPGHILLQLKKALEAVLAQPGARKPSSARFFRGQMQVGEQVPGASAGQVRWRYQSGRFPGCQSGAVRQGWWTPARCGVVEGHLWVGGVIGPTGPACPAAQRDQPPCLRLCVQTIISRALSDMGITPVPSRRCFTLMSELLWLGGSVGLAKGSAAVFLLPGACRRCIGCLGCLRAAWRTRATPACPRQTPPSFFSLFPIPAGALLEPSRGRTPNAGASLH